jgi:hypothetical protein
MILMVLATLLQTAICGQSDSAFKIAIEDETTAPYYVIVTIVNDSTGTSREVCTEAPFLLGAVHIEKNIAYTERGCQRVQNIVLSTKSRVFHFANRRALENLSTPYSEELLAATRRWVEGLAVEDMATNLDKPHLPVYNYYRSRKGTDRLAHQLALAHALVERGYFVRRGCVVDDLIVEKE